VFFILESYPGENWKQIIAFFTPRRVKHYKPLAVTTIDIWSEVLVSKGIEMWIGFN